MLRVSSLVSACLATLLFTGCSGSIDEGTGEPDPGAEDGAVDASIEDSAAPTDAASRPDSAAEAPADSATSDASNDTRDAAPETPPVACTKLRDKCAATSECCAGNVCDVTPLPNLPPTDTRCCRAEAAPCAEADDCCSYLLCSAGKCARRPVDGACRVDADCTTNKCTSGRCVDPSATTGYRLPLRCGGPYAVSQGNFDTKCTVYSHTGQSQYAYDFAVGLNTPVLAMRGGVVSHLRNDVKPGNPCYSGGGSGCINTVNYVTIKHPDGFSTVYVPLNDASVTVGQNVTQGEQIGLSGGTCCCFRTCTCRSSSSVPRSTARASRSSSTSIRPASTAG